MDTNANLAKEVVYKLEFPIEYGGEVIREVTVRRLKNKDRLAARSVKNDEEKNDRFLMSATGLTDVQLGELDMYDFAKITEILAGFFGSKSET